MKKMPRYSHGGLHRTAKKTFVALNCFKDSFSFISLNFMGFFLWKVQHKELRSVKDKTRQTCLGHSGSGRHKAQFIV